MAAANTYVETLHKKLQPFLTNLIQQLFKVHIFLTFYSTLNLPHPHPFSRPAYLLFSLVGFILVPRSPPLSSPPPSSCHVLVLICPYPPQPLLLLVLSPSFFKWVPLLHIIAPGPTRPNLTQSNSSRPDPTHTDPTQIQPDLTKPPAQPSRLDLTRLDSTRPDPT